MASRAVLAPAKINLFLHVVGRRADGYHMLDSLVAFADCHDLIRVDDSDTLTLALEGPFAGDLGDDADNLVLRAARALMNAAGDAGSPVTGGAAITLTKNLPVASGIGGGSADAAAALQALNSLWRLDLSTETLAEIGLSLGADVPVCLFGRPARFQGVGEKITAAGPLPFVGLVLVNPGVAVSTAKVFTSRQGDYSETASFPENVPGVRDLISALDETRNDLTPPAIALSPQIADVLAALGTQPDCLLTRLSGSGATCLGLFSDEKIARHAAAAIRQAHPDWWVHDGRFLTGKPPLSEDHKAD